MNYKDRIKSYRNPLIDSMIEKYQGQWKLCGRGNYAVINAYFNTNEKGYAHLTVDRVPDHSDDIKEFSACLIEVGITEFTLTEESTALMAIIIQLMHLDWVITGTFEGEGKGYPIRGLKLTYSK